MAPRQSRFRPWAFVLVCVLPLFGARSALAQTPTNPAPMATPSTEWSPTWPYAPTPSLWSSSPYRFEPKTPPHRVDPVLLTGIAITAFGTVSATAGAWVLASAKSRQVCGVVGCVDVPDYEGRIRGGALLAAGAAMGLAGLPMLVIGAKGETPAVGIRRGERRLTMGLWLTGFGAGATAFGLGLLAGDHGRDKLQNTAGAQPLALVGGAMILAGVPLALSGGGERESAKYEPPHSVRSEGRANAGLVLASFGVTTLAGGVVATASLSQSSGQCGCFDPRPLLGIPIVLAGAAMLGAGLPLWLGGAGEKEPTLRIGMGSASLDWRF